MYISQIYSPNIQKVVWFSFHWILMLVFPFNVVELQEAASPKYTYEMT